MRDIGTAQCPIENAVHKRHEEIQSFGEHSPPESGDGEDCPGNGQCENQCPAHSDPYGSNGIQ